MVKIFFFLVILLATIANIWLGVNWLISKDNILLTPVSGSTIRPTTTPLKSSRTSSNTGPVLVDVVGSAMEGTKGDYAIVIKNLKNHEVFYFQDHKVFASGSLYKLWVMAVVFGQLASGGISQDEQLFGDIASLNARFGVDPEYAELTEGAIKMTVKEALGKMITISHNYAAYLLLERVTAEEVSEFLVREGLDQSHIGLIPETSAFDTALFLEKLYQGLIVDSDYSQRMLEILQRQEKDDALPKYLPEGVKMAHKTGDIGRFKHDAGIVFSSKGDFIIVVLSESDSPGAAADRIGLLSKAVYDYFQSNGPLDGQKTD